MLKTFADFIIANQSDITFILALIGSIGSICGWIYTFITTRKRIEIDIVDYSALRNVAQFFINIQNKSFSPICINSISFLYDGNYVHCELIPKKIRGRDNELLCTPMFPLNLSPRQGCLHFFEFVNCPNISLDSDKKVSFVIHTNRGPIKTSVILGDTSRYLHIK